MQSTIGKSVWGDLRKHQHTVVVICFRSIWEVVVLKIVLLEAPSMVHAMHMWLCSSKCRVAWGIRHDTAMPHCEALTVPGLVHWRWMRDREWSSESYLWHMGDTSQQTGSDCQRLRWRVPQWNSSWVSVTWNQLMIRTFRKLHNSVSTERDLRPT